MKLFLTGFFLVILAGCSTALTSEGSMIRSVNSTDDLSECEFRGVITAKSPEFSITPAQETEYVMNDARNKVAEKGGTHMKILTNQQGLFTGASINAEAYRCGS
ncbi:hypothetical protein [Marinagarivorans algicola]|uniref:hypothetical protein n=1 Tax=Marinagarivorans algicola TaxID=1513270 RepID=UPI0006B68EAE|nr:hypothetical protein [Marinagarivorans algicola]